MSCNKLIRGINDLATVNPQLAREWHPTKNGNLKPTDVLPNSQKKVWWLYPYDDPVTGKHFNFEWEVRIDCRNRGNGCPYLSGRSVWVGFNDLATVSPQLAKQWHPTKNGNLKPTDVTINSSKKVWWLYPYDDSITGKHFDFEWEETIAHMNIGSKCPFLENTKVWQGFNDLQTRNPELAKQWHPTKNGNLKPTDVTVYSDKKVWWYLPYNHPKTGKHFELEWQATVGNRNRGSNCPYITSNKGAILEGFNDLATVNPQLAKEWHPTKNGYLKPTDVASNSNKKVWWLLPYNDEKTGKHFDFEWKARIISRNNGGGCPYLSTAGSPKVWKGFNDLATVNPELAKEWHPTKNGNLKPEDVLPNSQRKVWWLYPYDDPVTGKHFDFEWQTNIVSRNKGSKCPYITGKSIWIGFNDLATVSPQLAKQWHPTKNGNLKPTDVTVCSDKKVWWLYSYNSPKTGEHYDFEWQATISNRKNGNSCPFLNSSKTEILIYDLLKRNNFLFKAEELFDNCRDKLSLPFDIYLSNKNIIIECDGMQHFKPVKYFGGKEKFKIRKFHDNIKNNFCKENDIPILRIPYTYDPVVNKQKIESLVLEFIRTKTVPQEILDFYSQHKFNNYVECATELNKRFLKRVA